MAKYVPYSTDVQLFIYVESQTSPLVFRINSQERNKIWKQALNHEDLIFEHKNEGPRNGGCNGWAFVPYENVRAIEIDRIPRNKDE
jgi:hypothetical protein